MQKSIGDVTAVGNRGFVASKCEEAAPATRAAVESYLSELLTGRKSKRSNPQNRTFTVRVTLGIGEQAKLAFWCRRSGWSAAEFLACHAKKAVLELKETEENWREIHAMCSEIVRRTQPALAMTLTPENAATLEAAAAFLGDGETPENIVNEFCVGGHDGPLGVIESVLDGCDRPESEVKELLAKAEAKFKGKA